MMTLSAARQQGRSKVCRCMPGRSHPSWVVYGSLLTVDSLLPLGLTTRTNIWTVSSELHRFLANVNLLRYVCYMLWAVRLSSVCLSVVCLSVCLSVTFVHPTQAVELFGFFSPYDSPGTLLFWCQKSLLGDAPFPLKFCVQSDPPPFK